MMDDRSSWVAFLIKKKESFRCALRAHVCPSLHVVPVGVRLCRRLPLLHDSSGCVSRRSGGHVTPQSMRGGCEMLTVQLSHCFAVCLTQRCLVFTSGCFCALEAVFVFVSVLVRMDSALVVVSPVQSLSKRACPSEPRGTPQ